jgi:hypothetical protein
MTFLSAFLWAIGSLIIIVVLVMLIVAGVSWISGRRGGGSGGCCSKPHCAGACPIYLRNPTPVDNLFPLGRVDGSIGGENSCATGVMTIQRSANNLLLYNVTTPVGSTLTDIYALEVEFESQFPLTSDGCTVDLTQFKHVTFDCATGANSGTLTSDVSSLANASHLLIAVVARFSADGSCISDSFQLMTLTGSAANSIPLTGNCITPECAASMCCDPVVPNYMRVQFPKCRVLSISSPASPAATIPTTATEA